MLSGASIPLLRFPEPHRADATGLVAISPDINWEMLLTAYTQGLFPWGDRPVRWYSPDPRAIFERHDIHLPSNLSKLMKKAQLRLSYDTAFTQVIEACAKAHEADGVWITARIVAAYTELHAQGFAHSVEVWQSEQLVGGLYGVQIGGLFAGESMFYTVSNASKAAFSGLVTQLDAQGITIIDTQFLTAHTKRLGAKNVARADYLKRAKEAIAHHAPGSGARWQNLDIAPLT